MKPQILFEFKCKGCGKINYKRLTSQKVFCNNICQTRFNSRLRYERIKNDKKYKKLQKANFKKWRENNREYHNEYYRKKRLLRHKKS